MMLNIAKLYSLVLASNTLMFTQGHRVMRKVGQVHHSVVKLPEATHLFVMVYFVREMTVK